MNRNRSKRIISLLLIAVMCICCMPVISFAADRGQLVVVGACPDYGIDHAGNGMYSGIAYDYLNESQRYTGHRYTYVEANRDELLKMLAEGKIDILPCVSEQEYESFLERYYDTNARSVSQTDIPVLSSVSITKRFTAIYAYDGNEDIPAYFDTAALKTSVIGYLSEDKSAYFINDKFIYGEIDGAQFVEYTTEEQMHEDFISGKLDAVVKENFRCWEHETIVYQYGTSDCYFLTTGSDPLLAGQLDVALNSIHMSSSAFFSEMYKKHIEKYGAPKYGYSLSELNYIESTPEITIAYNLDSTMSEEYNSGTGELTGDMRTIIDAVQSHTGIKINIRTCNSLYECVELLDKGEVQAICGGVNRDSMESYGSYRLSSPFITIPIVFAAKKDANTSKAVTIAVPADYADITHYIQQSFPDRKIVHYDSMQECMDAVKKGEADAVCAGVHDISHAINNGYSGFTLTWVSAEKHSECFAFAESCTNELPLIIGKNITRIKNYSDILGSYENSVSTGYAALSAALPVEVFYFVLAACLVVVMGGLLYIFIIHYRNRRAHGLDTLTGGRNKQKFMDDGKKLLKKMPADKLAMALFDINKFKFVNDRLGYEEGDRMLVRLHKTIADNLESDEIFARLSDDNFAVIIRNTTDNDISARLNTIFSEFDRRNGLFVKYPVVFSAGVCRLGQCSNGSSDIDLNIALDRCKIAKRTLKGQHYSSIAFYDGKIREKALREKDYENIMPVALAQREFECYLQPKYGLKSRHIEGAEALIRWNSKEFGFVFPNDFIPISEKNGFVVELDFFILEEVCRAMRRWIDSGIDPVVVSVNQSRLHLNYDDYIWRLREIVDKYEIPYEYIELELTESVFTENTEKLLTIMHKLHDIGFKLSLDDFGSGYSSLNMLKDIPVDVVKIDREFFNGTVNSEKGRAVISTVVDLASNLNMEVISEGVETKEQVEFLTEIKCAMVQGYYFAKPMNMDSFEELWSKDRAARVEDEQDVAEK